MMDNRLAQGMPWKQKRNLIYLHRRVELCCVNNNYDFVIIKLKEKVIFGNTAIHACLPTQDMDDDYIAGETLTVSGWGHLESDGSAPNALHSVNVPFVPNTVCKEKYGNDLTDEMLCAGNIEDGGVDSCQGDSGGM